MVPSNKWFPTSLQERAAWFQNLRTQFAAIAVQLGFLPAQVTAVIADNEDMQFLANAAVEVEAYSAAVRQFRKVLTEGDAATGNASWPLNPSLAPPAQVNNGIYDRLDNLVKRIRLSPAYNDEIGALLGIIPTGGGNAPEVEMQPSLRTIALPGSVLQVKFVRGNADGVVVETKIDNSDTWTEAGKFSYSPADLNIPANPQGLPRAVQLRARFLDKDTPVGQFSDVVTTATVPGV